LFHFMPSLNDQLSGLTINLALFVTFRIHNLFGDTLYVPCGGLSSTQRWSATLTRRSS